ncbi:pyridoxal phosphate-dependent aminotransferase [Aureliella helgolandensis]|uniref:Aminotransferase n=1 Tax=Aureliella helgolandensis TaxID=2527968 RepID=A0A518GH10_9BACT|nr:aminotransferase class I/II-fold pyridoxal phosphate-dependent enzyme [Aureliella helgolandensis]QDV27886.1 Putative N-acetyl-LL-diaminopimelate aminotransferase [Aureliella helgolandensis]
MTNTPSTWIADRTKTFDSSGIRKVFDLAAKLKNPVNLSIGQPDFDVPQTVKDACVSAIEEGRNAYSLTQGIAPLREKLRERIQQRYGHSDRDVFISSGTSGGLVLSMLSLVNPGDEVVIFDPYFVMYAPLVQLVGGVPIILNTYPDFRIDLDRVESAITSRTKLILFNSPSNPTGITPSREEVTGLAELAARHNVALISDEIYSEFVYDGELQTPADHNPNTIVIDGFSKSHAMTGWRVGWVHGPSAVIQTMIKLQQYSFVCAPQPAQWAGLAAMDVDMASYRADYRAKRDMMIDGLKDNFEFTSPGGAFYLFPKAPWGTGTEFVTHAIEHDLLMIPGAIFSSQDTHFRISYAAPQATLERGLEILNRLAKR